MIIKSDLNNRVINNFKKVSPLYFIPPFFILFLCFSIPTILKKDNSYVENYISIQKETFYSINSSLSSFPNLEYNLTQLGDVIILFSFIAIFVLYTPKLWETIILSSLLSLIVAALLKKVFNMPRPAAIFNNDSFIIIGPTLKGNTSLPSGHSMTTFIIITLLLIAFMPKQNWYRLFWFVFILILGFIITFSRVGVGAHYPLDVIIGSSIGSVLAIISVLINNRITWKFKLKSLHQNIILISILLIWIGLVIIKILSQKLLIDFLALIPLLITLYLIKLNRNVQK